MVHLTNGEDLINKMRPYFDYLSQRTMEWEGLWTAPYLDAWGLGVAITYAVPAVSKITGRQVQINFVVKIIMVIASTISTSRNEKIQKSRHSLELEMKELQAKIDNL